MFKYLDNYIIKLSDYCEDPRITMTSTNVNDAKKECTNNPSCHMFYKGCEEGAGYYACRDSSTEFSLPCGELLYKKYNNGNLSTINPF